MDFGRLAEVLRDASIASANKAVGPVVIGHSTPTSSDYNMGSLGLSSIMHNEVYGDPNQFLWTVHSWDDRIHKVTA